MVDSAVNLSIGTELDLSGLERDLAALKDLGATVKLDIDTSDFIRKLKDLESELDCIHVQLCIDDSAIEKALSKTYKVNVEFEPDNLNIKNGKVELTAETLNIDLASLEQAVTENFGDLLNFLAESERNAASRNLTDQISKPLTDIITGFFEGIGRDVKKGVNQGLESRTGFSLENGIGFLINSGKTPTKATETDQNTAKILAEVVDIAKSSAGILAAVTKLGDIQSIPNAVSDIANEVSKLEQKAKGKEKEGTEKSGAITKPGAGGIPTIEVSLAKFMAFLAQKGILQAAAGATQVAKAGYGALKGAENAVLSLDPTGIAKVVKQVITPLAITAAATQVPGAGMAVSGAVQITQAALSPLTNALGAEMISALSGAIADVVGGLPLIGGQLEAGLVATITGAITEAIAAATGLTAAGVVGKALQAGTGAATNYLAPGSDEITRRTESMSQNASAKLLADLQKLGEALSVTQLPGTTSVFPSLAPSFKNTKQLKGSLDQNLNIKGLQDVYKQLTGSSGVGKARAELVKSIEETFKKDAKAVQQALAKVSAGGLKPNAQIATLGKPSLDPSQFIADLQKVTKTSNQFLKKFDAADADIKKQTKDGLANLIKIVNFQISAIDTVKKKFEVSGKASQQIGGYESQLKSQLKSLQSRYKQIGGNLADIDEITTEQIRRNWKRTENSVKANIQAIASKSQASWHDIQQGVSEGSPGPTEFIRKAWKMTVGFVIDQIDRLKNASQESWEPIQSGVSPNYPQPDPPRNTQAMREGAVNLFAQAGDAAGGLSQLDSIAENLGGTFSDLIGVVDDLAGGVDIRKALQNEVERIRASDLSDERKAQAIRDAQAKAQSRLDDRGQLTSNLSSLVGSTAFSFAPLATIKTLFAPLAIAFTPLIAAFETARNTIYNFVSRLNQLLQEITPLTIRFRSVSGEQTKYLDKEIAEREAALKRLQGVTGQESAIREQQQAIAALKSQRESMSPDAMMAVPKNLAQEYSIPVMETLKAYSKFVAASTGTALAGEGVERLFTGISQAIAALGLNAQDAELVFMAFQQMMSKGKITAEELRQQLAERMPGAVQLFAEAIGVSQAELNDLLQQGALQADTTLLKVSDVLTERYSSAAKEAGDSIVGANNRIKNAVQEAQLAVADLLTPAFTKATNLLVAGLEFFAEQAQSIFMFVLSLFSDVILTMSVSWAAVWSKFGGTMMKAVAPLFAAAYKYLAPFAINIGVDFVDTFYKVLTGKDVLSPLQILFDGVENIVWTVFTAIKSFGNGVKSVFTDIANYVTNTFGGMLSFFGGIGNVIASLGVPVAELATTFVFLNQTMAFMGLNAAFFASAAKNIQFFFAEVATGAGRMRVMENAIKGVTLGLDSLQIKVSAVAALLFLMFAKSDFRDPLKVELDKTLNSLEKIREEIKGYQKDIQGVEESTKQISKGFNVTLGISEALGGQKIMTDDVIRALRGDLGEAANQAAYGFLAVITAGIGVAMLPLKDIAKGFNSLFGEAIAGMVSYLGAAMKDYPRALLYWSQEWLKSAFNAAAQFARTMGEAIYKAMVIAAQVLKVAAGAAGQLIVKALTAISPILGQAATLFGRIVTLSIKGLGFVFSAFGKAIAVSFAATVQAFQGLFARMGRFMGRAVPEGAIGGIALIAAALGAVIADIVTGGAVRRELTNLAKRFGLIAVAEMQAEQRRAARKESVTATIDAVKQTFFVEFEPGQLEKELADVEAKIKEKGFAPFSKEKKDLEQRKKFLQEQIEGQRKLGRIFFGELTEEAKATLGEVASLDKNIIRIQQRMNEIGRLSVEAEITGNTSAMAQYNAEYERLNKQLDQELSTRNALIKPYQDMLTQLKNMRQALTDELNAIQSSGEFDPEGIKAITFEIERVDKVIAQLEENGVTNLTLLEDQFNKSAAAIEKNNEKLQNLLREIDRVKSIQLANIAEAFASGEITDAQRQIRTAQVELQSLQRQLSAVNAIYQENAQELNKLMSRPTQSLSDEEKSRQKELIQAVKDQEMQIYEIRTSLADATVEARRATEEAISASVTDFAERNKEAVLSEAEALQELRGEMEEVLKYAQMLSDEGGLNFTFNQGSIFEFRQFLESVVGSAAAVGVELGNYVAMVGDFAAQQQEIDRLMSSKLPGDQRKAGEKRKALAGDIEVAKLGALGEINAGAIDSQLKAQLKAIQSTAQDVFAADVEIAQAYVTRNNALINARREQIFNLIKLEESGLISKEQRAVEEKRLNEEIDAIQENQVTRRETLLNNELAFLDAQEEKLAEAAAQRAENEVRQGGNIVNAQAKWRKELAALTETYTNARIAAINEESRKNKEALDSGLIGYEEFIEKEKELEIKRQEIVQSSKEKLAELNTQEIENLEKIKTALKEVADVRAQAIDAQLSAQEKLTQATQVYSDALGKQAELIQANSKLQNQAANAAIRKTEQEIALLEKKRDKAKESSDESIAGLEKQRDALKERLQEGESSADISKTEAEIQKLQADTARETARIEEEIQRRQLAIANEKAKLLEKEQATQRQLLAIEIERNKIASMTQIKEAEIAALRARNALVSARIDAKIAETQKDTNPAEFVKAQLALQLAQEEFNFALAQIDITKQSAIISDKLAELEKQGLLGDQAAERDQAAFEFDQQFDGQRRGRNPFEGKPEDGFKFTLDDTVKKLADLGESLKSNIDVTKYDQLIEQLDKLTAPLEQRLTQEQAMTDATNKLATGVNNLNDKIQGLINTLGRPNITITGNATSLQEAIDAMRYANR